MSSKKIVTVFGATGKQGGGAVQFLSKDESFHVRAVTRNPESDAAKKLVSQGVEIVKADLNDKASLVKAMQGAYGVFGITDYWTANGAEEIHGKNLVDAAKQAGIQHFVWSTIEHSELKIPHCETKANVNDYLIASGIPRTSLYTAWFFENVGSPHFCLKRDASDGSLVFDLPFWTDGPIAAISGKDCGVLAAIALTNPDKYIGKDLYVSVEITTPRKVHAILEEVLGEKIKLKEASMQDFENARNVLGEELWLNYKWFYIYAHDGRDIPGTLAILPKARTLKECIEEKGRKALLPQ